MKTRIPSNKKMDIWDVNWEKGIAPDVHLDLLKVITKYAKGKKVLEVGFGSGGDLIELSKKSYSCFGVETSKVAFDNAKKIKRFKPFFENAENTHFGNSFFDLIFHQGVMEHFKNPNRLLKEHYRTLKSGGVVVIDVPHKWNLFTLYRKSKQINNSWYGGWERSYSEGELKDTLISNGFESIGIIYRGIWPHQWGKFIFPEEIKRNKWVNKIIDFYPIHLLQRLSKYLYKNNHLVHLLSSYNVIIVAKKV